MVMDMYSALIMYRYMYVGDTRYKVPRLTHEGTAYQSLIPAH